MTKRYRRNNKRLQSQDLLNDEKFAKSYINDKLYLTNYGLTKIKMIY